MHFARVHLASSFILREQRPGRKQGIICSKALSGRVSRHSFKLKYRRKKKTKEKWKKKICHIKRESIWRNTRNLPIFYFSKLESVTVLGGGGGGGGIS